MSNMRKNLLGITRMLTFGTVSLVLLAGCSSTGDHVVTGMSLEDYGTYGVTPGDAAPDFAFVDREGQRCRFSGVRGSVTLLIFADDLAWPDCTACRRTAELARSLSGRVHGDVVAVSVGHPDRSDAAALSDLGACQIEAGHLVAICDRHDQIARLYGPQARGKFYVISDEGRIMGLGAATDHGALEVEAQRAVKLVAAEQESGADDYLW